MPFDQRVRPLVKYSAWVSVERSRARTPSGQWRYETEGNGGDRDVGLRDGMRWYGDRGARRVEGGDVGAREQFSCLRLTSTPH